MVRISVPHSTRTTSYRAITGHGRLQIGGLPGRARQDEQPRCAQDRYQAMMRDP